MSQRINISVPYELDERLKNLKGKLKISPICQRALDKAAMLEETKGSEDIGILKKRIKKERELLFEPYFAEGFRDGTKEAYSYSYKKFQIFLSNLEGFYEDHGPNDLSIACEYAGSKVIAKIVAIQSRELLLGDLNNTIGLDIEQFELLGAEHFYCKGWEDGVKHIWNQVKEA